MLGSFPPSRSSTTIPVIPEKTDPDRLIARYRVAAADGAIEARARMIAVEQSVELDPAIIADETVHDRIVGRVERIEGRADGAWDVDVALAVATTGGEAGQLMNMLFGNSSIHPDLTLEHVTVPAELARRFGGPHHGIAGLRRRIGVEGRALTCSALKPQGLKSEALAALAGALAAGGIDLVKDDHGLADQAYSPFAERVPACAAAVRAAAERTGHPTRYLPSLNGDLDQLRRQLDLVRRVGLDTVLAAPMVIGLPAFHRLTRDYPDIAFMAHPALAGALRIAPPLLLGSLFRLFGADATIFPNHGGRFGYSAETCREIAEAARGDWHGLAPAWPVPAGGMTLARVGEMLRFYGADTILLIGGDLLAAGPRLTEATRAFVDRVAAGG